MKEEKESSSTDSSAEAQRAKAEASEDKEKKELNIEELKECQKLKEEYLAGWQRARADLLNYKKEEMERIGELVGYATEELILKVLPILDNFWIAEQKLPEDLKNNDNVKGILLIKNQILDFLKSQGVEEIKSVGEKFDPNLHEVIEEVEPFDAAQGKENGSTGSPQEKSGIILEEIKKGYKINGRLLRPAKVKVTK
jgi:molecular chaperone GrpE